MSFPQLLFHLYFQQVELANYLYQNLRSVPNVRIYGPPPSQEAKRAALCSFNVDDVHPTDIATFLDQQVWAYIFFLVGQKLDFRTRNNFYKTEIHLFFFPSSMGWLLDQGTTVHSLSIGI